MQTTTDNPRHLEDALQEFVDDLRDAMGEEETFTAQDVFTQTGDLEPVNDRSRVTPRLGNTRKGALQRIIYKLNACAREGLLRRNNDGTYSFVKTGLDTDITQPSRRDIRMRAGAIVDGVDQEEQFDGDYM